MEPRKARRPYSYGHLYVMQAACGLIKVGRSIDPEARRVALSQFIVEDIALVAVLADTGKEEEAAHLKLKRYRRHIEWFSGTDVARKAVERVLCLEAPVWPYPWQPKLELGVVALGDRCLQEFGEALQGLSLSWRRRLVHGRQVQVANELLSHLGFWRDRAQVRKLRRRVINALKDGDIQWWTNSEICAATMGHPYLIIHIVRENPTVVDRRTGEEFAVPDYLFDHDTAATVGPPGWEGVDFAATPAQIVIAGLEARTKWERQQMSAEQEGADEDTVVGEPGRKA
jgi:hypothetical protein